MNATLHLTRSILSRMNSNSTVVHVSFQVLDGVPAATFSTGRVNLCQGLRAVQRELKRRNA